MHRPSSLLFQDISPAFDSVYDSMSSSVLQELIKQTNIVDNIITNLKPDCRRDIEHTRKSARKHKLWALRMLDSNGKIPSGVTYGRFSSPGDYEECLSVNVNQLVLKENPSNPNSPTSERHKFHGKYCLIDFRLPLPEKPKGKLLSIHEPVLNLTGTELLERYPEIANYSAYASVFYEIGYMHGLCVPSTCDVVDLTKSIGRVLEGLHVIVNNTVDCEEKLDEPLPLRRSQVISLYLFGILFLNATLASVVYFLQPKGMKATMTKNRAKRRDTATAIGRQRRPTMVGDVNRETGSDKDDDSKFNVKRWLRSVLLENTFYADCFSVQKNFERLAKPDPRGLAFVHYTRIVAMALTVVTHTAALGTLQAITKPADAANNEQIFRDFLPQMLANAFTSIQIFFFMAGFMLVISTYPSIRRDKGHISFVEYAIKRAIRLMPGLAATICINFLWPLIVDGPMLTYFIRMIVVPCESNWWRTLGFLSNFDHVEKMCLRHSYFSASDYQLHLMAFPLLILLYKQPSVALFMAGLLTVGGFIAQVIMVLTKTLLPFVMVDYIDKDAFFNVVHYIHHPVWNHMSAFFYGFIIGYLVAKQIRIDLSETTIKRIWLLTVPAGIISIYAPYYWNHYKRPIYKWQMVIYVIVDRFVLLTVCAWISYGSMVLGQKPRAKKSTASGAIKDAKSIDLSNDKTTGINLPTLITLEKKADLSPSEIKKQETQLSSANVSIRLAPAGLPRQRSSPNLENSQGFLDNCRVGRTVSSIDLANPTSKRDLPPNDDRSHHVDHEEKERVVGGEKVDKSKPVGQQTSAPRRENVPISNVNTLCLILSRLTFQLYLFNMVVLWVDVNHSKYYWFFSYYFIITKAFGVYVCSSIMALIFFVTLESPCLTLYIAWVKSRAVVRAKKQVSSQEKMAKQKSTGGTSNKHSDLETVANQRISMSPLKQSPGSSVSGKSTNDSNGGGGASFDGLCMRSGAPSDHQANPIIKPTFSFIDLSNKPTSLESNENQTRM